MRMHARLMGVTAALGFLVSLAVHVYTYLGESLPHRFPPLWLLHVGVFFVFGPAVLVITRASKAGTLRNLLAGYPKAVIALAVLVHVYASAVGYASFTAMQGAVEDRPSGYALVNRGELIRELTEAEFLEARAIQTRGFSSVWLSFYGLSALFWLFLKPESTSTPNVRRTE
jgi:hypothetical protein